MELQLNDFVGDGLPHESRLSNMREVEAVGSWFEDSSGHKVSKTPPISTNDPSYSGSISRRISVSE
jgi:hypothetical protein